MRHIETMEELTKTLREERKVLWAPRRRSWGRCEDEWQLSAKTVLPSPDIREWKELRVGNAGPETEWSNLDHGMWDTAADIAVPVELFNQIDSELRDETSEIRKLSTRPIQRSFVYVDISDYSKMPDGLQLLVVLALIEISDEIQLENVRAEAQLCIGDGYVYVWPDPLVATRFAARLATLIEGRAASGSIPEFHFRIGVHVGPVHWFWDPGRKDWNYVGSGINGGNRVLSAIGKDTDDVVFVSADVRQAIQGKLDEDNAAVRLVQAMHNRGRRADKHGNLWRVYELNHSAQPAF